MRRRDVDTFPLDELGRPVAPRDGPPVEDYTPGSVTPEAPGRYALAPPGAPAGGETVIGEGAIGRVLLRYDRHLGREVAVKELREPAEGSAEAGPRSTARAARFLREARVTAQLEHPGVVPVHELGRRPDGTLYYVMKRVRGRTLGEAIAAAPDVRARLKLLPHLVDLCQAMAYAHARGVVHRDLKPLNVMVGEFGETVALDWGLAKVRGEADPRAAELLADLARIGAATETVRGAAMGTPAYMSPEQARGHLDAVDERSDVWSLGAILHELLTGAPPYAGSAHDVVEAVRAGPPPPPRGPGIPRELAAVAQKAMRLDPAERYPDARALAADLQAWLAGEPVSAWRYGVLERLGRLLQRYRQGAAVALLAGAAVVALEVVALAEIAAQRDRAMDAEIRARGQEAQARAALVDSLVLRANAALALGDPQEAWALSAAALVDRGDPDARGTLLAARSRWVMELGDAWAVRDRCRALAWSPDGATLGCMTAEGLWLHAPDGTPRAPAPLPAPEGGTGSLAWSPDGARLAGGGRGTVRLYTASPAAVVGDRAVGAEPVWALDWRDAATVIYGTAVGRMGLLPVDGGERKEVAAHRTTIRALAVAPGGGTVYAASNDGTLLGWDAARLVAVRSFEGGGAAGFAVRVSRDGRRVAVAGNPSGSDSRVRVFDVATGRRIAELAGHTNEVFALDWSPDGRWLASGGGDGTVRVWEVDEARLVTALGGHGARVVSLAFAPDGESLVVAGSDGGVRRWRLVPADAVPALPVQPRSVNAVAWSPDGRSAAVGVDDGTVVIWDVARSTVRHRVVVDDVGITALGYTPEGRIWALAPVSELVVVDPDRGVVLRRAPDTGRWPARGAALSPDGSTLVAPLNEGGFVRWTLAAGPGTPVPNPRPAPWWQMAWSVDGRLYGVDRQGTLATIDPGSGEARALPVDPVDEVYPSPDGSRLALIDNPRGVVLVGRDGEGARLELAGAHQDTVYHVAWAPDGARVASLGWDGRLAVWDARDGRLLARLMAHQNRGWSAAWSPDGEWLLTGGADRQARLWALRWIDTPAEALVTAARERLGLAVEGGRVVPLAPAR